MKNVRKQQKCKWWKLKLGMWGLDTDNSEKKSKSKLQFGSWALRQIRFFRVPG